MRIHQKISKLSKRAFEFLFILTIITLIYVVKSFAADGLKKNEILSRADSILSPQPFKGKIEMKVYKSDGRERTYRMTIYYQSKTKVLITFQYPEIENGRKILSLGDDMWMYMPSVKKTIRISPKQRFLDGDFTNGDVVRLDFNSDYTVTSMSEKDNLYKLDLKAKNMAITYGRVVYKIQKSPFSPHSQEFYALSGKLMKTLTMQKVLEYDHQLRRPSFFYMEDNFTKNKYTTLEYKSLEHGIDIPDFYYYKNNLGQF